jgi:hypothetical protein
MSSYNLKSYRDWNWNINSTPLLIPWHYCTRQGVASAPSSSPACSAAYRKPNNGYTTSKTTFSSSGLNCLPMVPRLKFRTRRRVVSSIFSSSVKILSNGDFASWSRVGLTISRLTLAHSSSSGIPNSSLISGYWNCGLREILSQLHMLPRLTERQFGQTNIGSMGGVDRRLALRA